ncbi:MAG: CRISPR-associated endonuclease Cas2 [Candidatus Electrothrix sp. EH2]|nr:CRISPR-associated endonuclease Cas2 [Candidatus Electrothrix sp. EH2]
MSNFSRYVIAYDISNQQERNRVSRILNGYGFFWLPSSGLGALIR